MNLAAYCHALAAIAYGVFAYSLLRTAVGQKSSTTAQRRFIAAVLLSAAWGLVRLVSELTGGPAIALGSDLLDLARYAAWFVFALVLLRPPMPGQRGRHALRLGIVLSPVIAVGVLIFVGGAGGSLQGFAARALPLASLSLPVVGMVLVEQLFRAATNDARWHTKPLCLGLASMFLYDVYLHSQVLLFGRVDADSLALRSAAIALPVALLYVATKRRADWSGSFQLSRNAVFHTATLMLAGVYLLLISASGYYVRQMGGDWGGALQLALLCVGLTALAVLLFSSTLRAKLRVFLGKNFFRYRYDYRAEWLRFTARLSAESSPQEVGGLVVRALAEILNSPAGALWYRDSDGLRLVQAARWKSARCADAEPVESPFARFMGSREWVVDLFECRAHPEHHLDVQTPEWLLANPKYWLVLPLIVGNQLSGFVVIERPHAVIEINWEIRDLLKTASRQAASYLALMHATDALLEARKFEAFNKMSAFVVHDLKNIVAQLSLMMQNARRLKGNAEFQEDMLTTVENSLEKMRRMMLQLRSGEAPAGASSGVALPTLVERIRAAASARGRAVDVHIVDPVVTRGHEERVERVLGHIVDNALDATEASGTVGVALSREGSQAKVTVTDTGQGMSPEFVRTRLFKPFSSTKAHGMGIGSYESHQYIQEIGGSLTVDSELGRGTVVTVRLPLFETGQRMGHELLYAK